MQGFKYLIRRHGVSIGINKARQCLVTHDFTGGGADEGLVFNAKTTIDQAIQDAVRVYLPLVFWHEIIRVAGCFPGCDLLSLQHSV